ASTARETIFGDVTTVVTSDRVVRPVATNPGVPTAIAVDLAALPGVEAVPMQVVDADVDGVFETIAGIDLPRAADMVQLAVIEGAVGDGATVGDRLAEDRGWDVGDAVPVTFPDGVEAQLTVGAIVEQTTALPAIVVPYNAVAGRGDGLDRAVLVAGESEALAAAEAALAGAPTAILDTVDGYASSLAGPLDTVLTMVIGFLG